MREREREREESIECVDCTGIRFELDPIKGTSKMQNLHLRSTTSEREADLRCLICTGSDVKREKDSKKCRLNCMRSHAMTKCESSRSKMST